MRKNQAVVHAVKAIVVKKINSYQKIYKKNTIIIIIIT